MCVLALAWRAHPHWLLVLAANRDELHARPAAPLARWPEADHVLAGRDLVSGGTWLGVSERGRLAVVTNLHTTGAVDPAAPSRGLLLRDLLTDSPKGHPTVETLPAFNPFNLISVADGQAMFASNHPKAVRTLPPGIYGLSNATLDTPWAKTERLKAAVAKWLEGPRAAPEALLEALADKTVAQAAGGPAAAPVFIDNLVFGTRCSTVVAITEEGRGVIVERRFTAAGEPCGDLSMSFRWPAPSAPPPAG